MIPVAKGMKGTAVTQQMTDLTREQLLEALERMRQRRAQWETLELQCMNAEDALLEKTRELEKRLRELDCLYALSDLVEKKGPLEDLLAGTVGLLPGAMELKDIVSARLFVSGKTYRTSRFRETPWKLVRPVHAWGRAVGFLEVNYLEEPPRSPSSLFEESEVKLVWAVAERLGRIIERKETEEKLRESEEKYATVVESTRDGIVIIQDYLFKYANPAMAEISGFPVHELTEKPFLDLFTADQRHLIHERYEMRLSGGPAPPPVYETKIQRQDGSVRNVEISFTVIPFGEKPADMGFVRDITERVRAEEEIRKLAYHDPLTGVPNRFLFSEQFLLARARASRYGEKMAVLLLDLDKFKEINDTLGHKTGDLLLQAVGKRLQESVRTEDLVARMGGDEFILLLQEIRSQKDAENTAGKIVEAFRRPFLIEEESLSVTISLGIALYPDHGEDLERLMKGADKAMYAVKAKTRDGFDTYRDDPKT